MIQVAFLHFVVFFVLAYIFKASGFADQLTLNEKTKKNKENHKTKTMT
jgi:hypothetical protein